MRRAFYTAAGLLALAVGSSLVKADTVFLNQNFDSDTAGQSPTVAPQMTPTPGNPVTHPTGLGGYSSTTVNPYGDSPNNTTTEGTINVGNATGISQGAVFTTVPSNAEVGALFMDTGFSGVTSNSLKLSFDLNVISGPANATSQVKFLNDPAHTAGILLGINTYDNGGNRLFDFAAAPTSSGGGVLALRSADNSTLESFFNYTNDTANHVEIDANFVTGNVDAYVNGTLAFSGPVLGIVPQSQVTTTEVFTFVNGESGYSNSVALDNIVGSTPEPGSLAVFGAASGLLMLRRRRTA